MTRAGCHLCEEMLATVRDEAGAAAQLRDLDLDAALAAGELAPAQHERWTTLVPVLLLDGREVAHHRLAPGQLASLLRSGTGDGRPRRHRRFGGSGGPNIE